MTAHGPTRLAPSSLQCSMLSSFEASRKVSKIRSHVSCSQPRLFDIEQNAPQKAGWLKFKGQTDMARPSCRHTPFEEHSSHFGLSPRTSPLSPLVPWCVRCVRFISGGTVMSEWLDYYCFLKGHYLCAYPYPAPPYISLSTRTHTHTAVLGTRNPAFPFDSD